MSIKTTTPKGLPQTRILATLGPASFDEETIEALARAGASGFRLNFSHGEQATLEQVIKRVRRVASRLNRPLALVGDLAGPKLRTGILGQEEPVLLAAGETLLLSPDFPATTPGRVVLAPEVLKGRLLPGARILVDDGRLELSVLEVQGRVIRAKVVHGGRLSSHKGVNLPGTVLDIPALSAKDARDLDFALEQGLDFIGLSFAREPEDVVDVKRRIAARGRDTAVIAKIENRQAVDHLSALLDVSDGVMVARGDLGVELGPEVLPVIQKEIIREARQRGKLVITATQMLESMTRSPRPTRAEASDVANAIFDGTDVVMLSEETAVGSFPVRTVETMARIARCAEESSFYHQLASLWRPTVEGVAHAAIRGACVAAEQVGAAAIIPFTGSGWTAFAMAAWRPRVPILPCTPHASSFQRLALCWGVRPHLIHSVRDIGDLYQEGMATLLRDRALAKGDMVVLLSGSVVAGTGANTMKISRVEHTEHTEPGHISPTFSFPGIRGPSET